MTTQRIHVQTSSYRLQTACSSWIHRSSQNCGYVLSPPIWRSPHLTVTRFRCCYSLTMVMGQWQVMNVDPSVDPRRLVIWKTNWKTLRSGTATVLGGRVIRLPLPYYQGHLLTPAYRPKYVMCVTLIGDTHSCGLDITNQSRRIFYQRIVGRMTVLFKWSLECSVSIVWCFTICLDIYVEVQRMIN